MTKNILHVLHYPHRFGGLETFITSLINSVDDCDHYIAFFGKDKGYRLKFNRDIPTFDLPCFTNVVKVASNIKADVLHLHWTGAESNNGKGVLTFLPTGQYTFLVQDGYDLDINSHPFGITQLPGLFKQGSKPKTIVTCHSEFKLPESVFYDLVVSVSDKAYQSQLHLNSNKHKVIYNGVDSDIFYPSCFDKQTFKKRKKLKAVWSGRLDKFEREVYEAIKADKALNEKYDFYYYGSGSLDTKPLPNHYFMGSVDHDKMPEILRRSDVFLYPTNCDSFGLALVEAMLTALPCITSEVVKDIAVNSSSNVEEVLERLHLFTSEANRFSDGLSQFNKAIENYTLIHMKKNYQEIYFN